MRPGGVLMVAVGLLAVPGRADQQATMAVTITVAPHAVVELVTPPTIPLLHQPNQAVIGLAQFRVSTNHHVTAYLGQPGDYLSGPGGTFRYGETGALLTWSASFPGQPVGAGLAIGAGAQRVYDVEVLATTAALWRQAQSGGYTGRLSLTLTDR